MASSIIHNDIKKLQGLLVDAVHMVKSPANRKKFFLTKGENKMNDEELKEMLKKQGISEDEINFILANDKIKSILIDDANEKQALEVVKDGIKVQLKEIELALESESITDITNKLIKPFEGLTSFLSSSTEDENNNDDKKGDDDKKDDDDKSEDSDEELDNSVSELVSEVSELAESASELADTIIE
jgi:hypothetical protein